jgi:hypothetical protein
MHHLLITLIGIAFSGAMLISTINFIDYASYREVATVEAAIAALERWREDVVESARPYYDPATRSYVEEAPNIFVNLIDRVEPNLHAIPAAGLGSAGGVSVEHTLASAPDLFLCVFVDMPDAPIPQAIIAHFGESAFLSGECGNPDAPVSPSYSAYISILVNLRAQARVLAEHTPVLPPAASNCADLYLRPGDTCRRYGEDYVLVARLDASTGAVETGFRVINNAVRRFFVQQEEETAHSYTLYFERLDSPGVWDAVDGWYTYNDLLGLDASLWELSMSTKTTGTVVACGSSRCPVYDYTHLAGVATGWYGSLYVLSARQKQIKNLCGLVGYNLPNVTLANTTLISPVPLWYDSRPSNHAGPPFAAYANMLPVASLSDIYNTSRFRLSLEGPVHDYAGASEVGLPVHRLRCATHLPSYRYAVQYTYHREADVERMLDWQLQPVD